jgi:hypothetical protein
VRGHFYFFFSSHNAAFEQFNGVQLAKIRKYRGIPAFKIYTRATVKISQGRERRKKKFFLFLIFCTALDLHSVVKATNLNSFDILACRPETGEMFTKCCESMAFDLVSLDFSMRGNWSTITQKTCDKVRVRGAFFEVACGVAFRFDYLNRLLLLLLLFFFFLFFFFSFFFSLFFV